MFARAIIADNDLLTTHAFIGSDKTLLELYLVLYILAGKYSEFGAAGQMLVPDAEVALALGHEISCQIAFPSHEAPVTYRFPSGKPPDVVAKLADGRSCNLTEIRGPLKQLIKYYEIALGAVLGDRFLFTTDTGLLSVGLLATEVGDIVIVFPGSATPFVLRKLRTATGGPEPAPQEARLTDETDSTIRCTLIGDCYIQGIMYGNIMRSAMQPEFHDRWVDVIIV